MDTNQLKRFAQETRRKLLQQVSAKLNYVVTSDTPQLREKAALIAQIKEEIHKIGEKQLIDKVTYTWFNRLVALRYMDCRDYQPLGIRIVSPLPKQVSPQILQEAIGGSIPNELNIDKKKVFSYLDGSINSKNAENDAYRLLLIAACNYLNRIFPFLFEVIDDFTELLLPDDLTSEFSVLHDLMNGISAEDCSQVEIIGWLYQFYISEKKDEVYASKEKIKKEDIPAATQLFTPRWVVEYMLQNTVGKLWMQNHPTSNLRQFMPYYIETDFVKSNDFLTIHSPEELTLLDQACGSGHILVYGFELLYKIYEEQGYNPSEIPAKIVSNNLSGFEIDERAAQLSGLAILLKAREYQTRLFKKSEVPIPDITCFQDLQLSTDQIKQTFKQSDILLTPEMLHDLVAMQQATNFGSLIQPHTSKSELTKVQRALAEKIQHADLFEQNNLTQITEALSILVRLSRKFSCIVDNPPYMGGNMNKQLSDYVKLYYPDSKADLMACFMEAGIQALKEKGALGMINQHSWMFLTSYENLRKKIIYNYHIDSLLHLGPRTFPEIGGEVVQNASFVFIKQNSECQGTYIRLVDYDRPDLKKSKTIEAIQNRSCEWVYISNQKEFEKIPGSPIGYWVNSRLISLLKTENYLGDVGSIGKGLDTGNNDRFLRYWYEVCSENGWIPCQKGGTFRKWYGNNDYVILWKDNGKALKDFPKSNLRNSSHYLKPGISWTRISTGQPAFRFFDEGSIFESTGPCAFFETAAEKWVLGFLNSNLVKAILKIYSPTLDFQSGHISNLPYSEPNKKREISDLVTSCINISRLEWDSKELSMHFSKNELIRIGSTDIEASFEAYQEFWKKKLFLLHENEEKINALFIENYKLENDIPPFVSLTDISILKDIVKIENNQISFNSSEIVSQFISYFVGCCFGRYSLDKSGLILSGQNTTLNNYYRKTGNVKGDTTFNPDEDNIIPILEDEWFEDDIVNKFSQFLKVSFGETNFRKNLKFLEEQIGMTIRKYFLKNFYNDHIQRYKKRPIYWMFSSPKGYFNVLIYLHRYTPDTLNNILNSYLREFIEKLKTRKEQLKHIETTGSAVEKTKSVKEMDKIELMLADCYDYERNILYPLATERIEIDLDNGVLVNYNCFGRALKEVKGLNDSKTKADVKKFDWIDSKIIR